MSELATPRKRIRPEIIIVSLLLLLPISVAVVFFLPRYYVFTAPGEIVSVQELGVDGSVNFTYVREGFTKNLYERWSTKQAFPDAEFVSADASVEKDFSDMQDMGEDYRDETIRNAITSADDEVGSDTDTEEPAGEFEQRLEALIEESTDYYGDSLGLMLAIGLVEEANQEDFSANGHYVIAGTGTIEADHTVGSVGSIRDKLRTAEQFGADYFLVPKDKERFYYEGLSNEEEASLVAEELGLTLQVVPVDTLDDALDFLRTMNP
ncbi:hypothetical protein [Cohnella luojiensis]|uniref:Lon proteolytic domain-containing protein n=1 Tax=Cohnella luojiensis TaxID=652876 RepID=A0A4Y8LVV8_9BACL|nr:hypothetical protein [Cohnella luojiensis]TFE25947.1 hypothetical protein E2980_12315 [Cohnella luojiensis]